MFLPWFQDPHADPNSAQNLDHPAQKLVSTQKMKSFGTNLVQGRLKETPEKIGDRLKTLTMISSFSILFLFSIFSCTFVVYCYLFCVISKVISSDPNLNPAPEIKLTQLHFNRLPTNSRGQKVKNIKN